MKKLLLLLFFAIILTAVSLAQINGYKCYPTNWWVGMQNSSLQLMLHGNAIANAAGGFSINYPGVKIIKVNKVENVNYIFLDIIISKTAKPGIVKVRVNRQASSFDIAFELKERRVKENGKTRRQ